MTVTGGQVVALAQTQDGGRYVFGAKASPSNPDPDRFDCSGLVAWVCRRLGVRPNVPDGAWAQWKHCTPCTLDYARRTSEHDCRTELAAVRTEVAELRQQIVILRRDVEG